MRGATEIVKVVAKIDATKSQIDSNSICILKVSKGHLKLTITFITISVLFLIAEL